MILTINFIGDNKLLAVCNLTIDTEHPEDVRNAYMEELPKVELTGTAADLMKKATEKVMERYPDMVLLDVNDDRARSNQKEAIHLHLTK